MTFAEIADHYAPGPEYIVGPYSPQSRRRPRRASRAVAFAPSLAAAGVILRRYLPLAL